MYIYSTKFKKLSVKVQRRLSLLILIGGFLHVKLIAEFHTKLYKDK